MVAFLEPEKIIEQLALNQNFSAAEFGCGAGGFSIALARILRQGIVYALDIQTEPLSALISRAKAEGLSNIRITQCDLEEPNGSGLQDNFLDLVLVTNILFQSDDNEAVIKEAKRIVKPGGRIVVVDWKPSSPFGPEKGRVSFDEIDKLVRIKFDMKLVKEIDAGTYHWAAIFEKKA